MKIVETILTKNPCYTAGKKITVKGLMLHSVGCPQPSAAVFVKNWNSASYDRACVHAFIDGNDGTVYQTLPWNHRGWHGGGASNNTHIGVEMCEPACIKYIGGATFTCSDITEAKAVAKRTYEAAVELFASLCKEYSLDPLADGVIISHAEGYKRGIASNHGDPEHLWKQLNTGYTMDGFRKAVKAAMKTETSTDSNENKEYSEKLTSGYYRVRKAWKDTKSQLGAYRILSNAKAKVDENAGYSVFDNDGNVVYTKTVVEADTKPEVTFEPYRVRVSITNLNIRKGPGINYDKVGQYTGVGVFTIVDVAEDDGATKWGLLKSYAAKRNGWISLDYAKEL
jgi:N-acetylmuramoyl-L-alanine amidase CwlA